MRVLDHGLDVRLREGDVLGGGDLLGHGVQLLLGVAGDGAPVDVLGFVPGGVGSRSGLRCWASFMAS
jgi:hypothetical protein